MMEQVTHVASQLRGTEGPHKQKEAYADQGNPIHQDQESTFASRKKAKEDAHVQRFLAEHNDAMERTIYPLIENYLNAFRAKRSTLSEEAREKAVTAERNRLKQDVLIPTILATSSLDKVQWALEDAIQKAENPTPVATLSAKKVGTQLWRNLKTTVQSLFLPVVSLLLSSLVANEMIVYPAPIRLLFFGFTFLVCFFLTPVLVLLSVFFLCKWGYDYYINQMSDEPKRLIMTTLFAFLPLRTKPSSSAVVNTLMSPFQYGEAFSKADGEELTERMKTYQESLHDAFPYVDALQERPPYDTQLKKIETSFHDLHREMAPPAHHANNAAQATNRTNTISPLPNVIVKPVKLVEKPKEPEEPLKELVEPLKELVEPVKEPEEPVKEPEEPVKEPEEPVEEPLKEPVEEAVKEPVEEAVKEPNPPTVSPPTTVGGSLKKRPARASPTGFFNPDGIWKA